MFMFKYPKTTGIFFLFLLCHAGYSPQRLITETSSWFSLIPAEMCESQASLNTQWDTSAVSDYEYIIHQKNLTLTDRETSSLYESWSNSPSGLSHEWCTAESSIQHLQLNVILALAQQLKCCKSLLLVFSHSILPTMCLLSTIAVIRGTNTLK